MAKFPRVLYYCKIKNMETICRRIYKKKNQNSRILSKVTINFIYYRPYIHLRLNTPKHRELIKIQINKIILQSTIGCCCYTLFASEMNWIDSRIKPLGHCSLK